jgi:hypothetical protein
MTEAFDGEIEYRVIENGNVIYSKEAPISIKAGGKYVDYAKIECPKYGIFDLEAVITDDGNEWSYTTDTISDTTPTDHMPIWIGFDDNGTPNDITDDVILGLVYDVNTAIYDALETELSKEFELERDGNNIRIGGNN